LRNNAVEIANEFLPHGAEEILPLLQVKKSPRILNKIEKPAGETNKYKEN